MNLEPSPRKGHCSAAIEGKLYVWGGHTEKPPKGKPPSTLHVFDPLLETWDIKSTTGQPPPGVYLGAAASVGHQVFHYGGRVTSTNPPSREDSFHHIYTTTLRWTKLPSGEAMKKSGSGMVACGNKLFLFGGAGTPTSSGPNQTGAEFIKDKTGESAAGWTNELHMCDLEEGSWSCPDTTGTRPPPCSHFSFTMVDDHRAVLFGGRQHDGRTNATYIIDLENKHWTELTIQEGEPWPEERSSHAAVCLGSTEQPQLLVIGGLDKGDNTRSDLWLLDIQSGKWRQVCNLQPRLYHSATAFSHYPGETEVVLFGGMSHKNDVAMANTTMLRFECTTDSKEWILTDVAESSQLGTNQRVRDKFAKLCHAVQTTTATPLTPTKGERMDQERKLLQAEARARAAEQRAEEAEEGRHAAEEEAEMAKEQLVTVTEKAEQDRQRAEVRLEEAERSIATAETRQQEAEREQQRLAAELQEAERRITEREASLRKCEDELKSQWTVERKEIQLTDTEIGRGGWATVREAIFRGTRVAAKFIHNQIICPYNIQLFRREIDMAARIRHPNLLQFIGATQEGEMVILTELMPTSLRKELERDKHNYMSPKQTISISLDVARALNYLHQMRPHPLIHRDISSANILLEPLPNGGWRAKVSDYGTVNLSKKLLTEHPGNPTYAAPEAGDHNKQSIKMDIFSFGVLLIEMLTGEFPEEQKRLLCKIHHQPLLALIRQCLSTQPEERPSASDIINELH